MLSSWNQAILRNEATVESPPPDLVFLPVKQKAKKRAPTPPLPAQPPVMPALFPWQLPMQYLPPILPPLPPPPAPVPVAALPAQTTPMATPLPNSEAVPVSSPLIGSDTDPMDVLRDYITWTTRRMPSAEDDLEMAYNGLRAGFHDLEDLKTFTDADWVQLSVPLGLGRRLTREVKNYQRERRKGA